MKTPITRDEVRSIMERVKENTERLNRCPGLRHVFKRQGPELFAKWRCEMCGGTVDTSAVHWYEKGLEHAKRS